MVGVCWLTTQKLWWVWEQNKIVPSEGVRAVGRKTRPQKPHLAVSEFGCILVTQHSNLAGWKWCVGEKVRKSIRIPEIVYSFTLGCASYAFDVEVIKRGFVAYIEAALANNFHKVSYLFLLGLGVSGHNLQQKEVLRPDTSNVDVSLEIPLGKTVLG